MLGRLKWLFTIALLVGDEPSIFARGKYTLKSFGVVFDDAELATMPPGLFPDESPHIVFHAFNEAPHLGHEEDLAPSNTTTTTTTTTDPSSASSSSASSTTVLWSGTLFPETFEVRFRESGPWLVLNPAQGSLVVGVTRFLAAQGVTQGEGCNELPCVVKKALEFVLACSLGTSPALELPKLCRHHRYRHKQFEGGEQQAKKRGERRRRKRSGDASSDESVMMTASSILDDNDGKNEGKNGDEDKGDVDNNDDDDEEEEEGSGVVSKSTLASSVRASLLRATAFAASSRAAALAPAVELLFGFDHSSESGAKFQDRLDLLAHPPPLPRKVLVLA
jgi:hypothetical protein